LENVQRHDGPEQENTKGLRSKEQRKPATQRMTNMNLLLILRANGLTKWTAKVGKKHEKRRRVSKAAPKHETLFHQK